MPKPEDVRNLVDELSKKLVDSGELIEAGWIGYRHLVMSENAPQIQIDECRMAFFAGAQHLFASIMSILEPGSEPTEKDLDRMTQIDSELKSFLAVFRAKHGV